MKKNLLLALLSMLTAFSAAAYDFYAKNNYGQIIFYSINEDGKTLTVVRSAEQYPYSDDFFIPSTVNHDGKTYTVTTIGLQAFFYKNNLTYVYVPETVTTIEPNAFANCADLTNVSMQNSVTTIGSFAFANCKNLKSITLPETLTGLGQYAFDGCSSLQTVTIPNSLAELEINPFRNCTGLKYFYGKFAYSDNKCLVDDGVLISFAPAGCTQYTIPYGITKIGVDAFYGASNLSKITIPESVNDIRIGAFEYCTSLKSLTIPESVTYISGNCVMHCDALEAFYGKFASDDNRCLISGTTLLAYAPAGPSKYRVPEKARKIGGAAFQDCKKLEEITLHAKVNEIIGLAFSGCTALNTVTMEQPTPPAYGEEIFNNIPLKQCKLYVPRNCGTTYQGDPFWSEFGSLAELPYDFCDCSQNDHPFYYCLNSNNDTATLTHGLNSNGSYSGDIVIPKAVNYFGKVYNVSAIGQRTFEWSEDMTSLFIPSTVSEIGEFAFFGCLSLKDVYVDVPKASDIYMPTTNGMFEYADLDNATLYVPKGSKSSYSNAIPWKYFGNIVEKDLSGVDGVVADPEADGAYFDLYGRRVDNPTRGLFIRNGKKVILK